MSTIPERIRQSLPDITEDEFDEVLPWCELIEQNPPKPVSVIVAHALMQLLGMERAILLGMGMAKTCPTEPETVH